MTREFAVKYSFLISIPAVLGANVLTLFGALKDEALDAAQFPAYLLGMLAAMVSGYLSICLVKFIARKGKFGWFAVYCGIVGFVTIILTFVF